MENEKKKKKRVLWIILFAVSFTVLVLSAFFLFMRVFPFKDSYEKYKKPTEQTEETVDLPDNPIDFDKLKETNADVQAWITLPGTTIDYPILQSAADEEEDFYLNHGIDKKYLFDGCVYIQRWNKNDFSDPVTLIYGHDLANGKMFTPLRKFRKQDFFQQQDTIYIYRPQHVLTYRLYTAFVFDDRHILYSYNFDLKDEFQKFLDETLAPKSMVRNVREGVSVTTDDQIIILSTCTNKEHERYLVGGVLIDDQLTK